MRFQISKTIDQTLSFLFSIYFSLVHSILFLSWVLKLAFFLKKSLFPIILFHLAIDMIHFSFHAFFIWCTTTTHK
jgi:hypothetical protein